MRRLIERHPDGTEEWFHWDDGERKFHIEYKNDVQPQLDRMKEISNTTGGWSKSREWKLLASVPIVVQLEMIKKFGADPFKKGNEKLMKRVLNDPDYRYLRVGGVI